MPRLQAVAVTLCLAGVPAVQAAEFSWEPSGLESRFDQDPRLEVDRSSLAVTRYFAPVDDASGPYGLAPFLDPETRVSAAFEREESRARVVFLGPPPFSFPEFVTETDRYSVGGRYVFPESKWYAGGRYGRGDVDESPLSSTATTELEQYGAHVGKYLGADTALELSYDLSETRREQPALCFVPLICPVGATTIERTRADEWGIAAQHVLRGRALTYSLSGRIAETSAELTIRSPRVILPPLTPPPPGTVFGGVVALPTDLDVDLGELRVYSVAGELFPTQRFGVRIGYSRWDGDTAIDDAYDVTATWFVTRHLELAFTFSRQGDKNPFVDDGDTAALRIVGRL